MNYIINGRAGLLVISCILTASYAQCMDSQTKKKQVEAFEGRCIVQGLKEGIGVTALNHSGYIAFVTSISDKASLVNVRTVNESGLSLESSTARGLQKHKGCITAAAFLSGDKYLFTASQASEQGSAAKNYTQIFDVEKAMLENETENDFPCSITSLALRKDGTDYYSAKGLSNGQVLVSHGSLVPVQFNGGPLVPVVSMEWSLDESEKILLVLWDNGTARLLNVMEDKVLSLLPSKAEAIESSQIGSSNDGTDEDKSISLIDQQNLCSVKFSSKGNLILSGSSSGELGLWDGKTGTQLIKQDVVRSKINSVAFHPTSTGLLVIGSEKGFISLWSIEKSNETYCFTLLDMKQIDNSPILLTAFSQDGKRLIGVIKKGTLYWWDIENWSKNVIGKNKLLKLKEEELLNELSGKSQGAQEEKSSTLSPHHKHSANPGDTPCGLQ